MKKKKKNLNIKKSIKETLDKYLVKKLEQIINLEINCNAEYYLLEFTKRDKRNIE
jgi:DNA repair photolyase